MFLVALWLLIIDWQRLEQPFFAERHELRFACCPVCGLVVGELSTPWVYAYLSFVTFLLRAIQVLWLCMEIGMKNLSLFLPSRLKLIDVETQNDVTHVQILVLRHMCHMWFTLDLHRYERYSAPRGRCQLKSFFVGRGGKSSVNHLPVPVHRSMSQHQLWLEMRNRGKFFILISIQSYKIPD